MTKRRDLVKEIREAAKATGLAWDRVREGANHEIEKVGARLRGLMPWLASERLVDKSKN